MKTLVEPAPSAADRDSIAAAIATIRPPDDLKEWFGSYSRGHQSRLSHDLAIFRTFAKGPCKVVEFGPIPLILTAALRDLADDLTVVDIDPWRFSETISELPVNVVKRDIEQEVLPFADGTFDIALFNELFEHLRINPVFTLREVFRILKPGGTLLLSTPNLRSLKGIYYFLVKNRGAWCCPDIYNEYSKLEKIGHMGHVREYTTTEVQEFLERIGFQVEATIYRGGYKKMLQKAVVHLAPSLRPYATYVAMRPGAP